MILAAWCSIGYGQSTFLKQLDHLPVGDNVTIKPTPDGGWVIGALDSVQLFKFDQCGQIEWSKRYDIENVICCIGNRLIITQNNKIVLLTHEFQNGIRQLRVTSLDLLGNVEWSKAYSKTNLDIYSYELMENQEGDILIYYNSSPAGASLPNNLTKIDANGNIIWSNSYGFGNIWGTAIVTQDTGTLFRTGKTIFKLDKNGTVDWSVRLVSPNTYYYLTPVEVSDGYIFSQTRSGGTDIGFFKFDKQGILLWGGVRYTGFGGVPNPLRKTSNDGFATVFNKSISGRSYPVIVEFDKDLNVVKQNAFNIPNETIIATDYAELNTDYRLVTGFVDAANDKIFHAKVNSDLEIGCDTLIIFQFDLDPATYAQTTHPMFSFVLNVVDENVSVTDRTISDAFLCGNPMVKSLDLGADITICPSESLTLRNKSNDNFSTYLWSTGATTETIEVTLADTYLVKMTADCDPNVYRDTIIVKVENFPSPDLVTDTLLCGTNGILLDATIPNGFYTWQDGSTNPTYLAGIAGTYFVDIDYMSCSKRFISNVYDCEEVVIPNIFTPNGDGYNDYFQILYEGVKAYKISVYNRWGVLQFESDRREFHWDGTVNGVGASDGVYFYVLTIDSKVYKGTVQLQK
jgi:gliding motility-associated-like protein